MPQNLIFKNEEINENSNNNNLKKEKEKVLVSRVLKLPNRRKKSQTMISSFRSNETDENRRCRRPGDMPRHHTDNKGRHKGREVQKGTHH